jgi:prepilin-type processing-associated H-X9-DG protein
MKYLGVAIQIYAGENSGSYPLPKKWFDLVTPDLGDLADKAFYCPAGKEYKYHYAMNPNCKPNSPPDTVLLFETQDSNWNLFGGKELLTTKNHDGSGCNILFNDGSIAFIKKEDIPNLKWNAEKIIE